MRVIIIKLFLIIIIVLSATTAATAATTTRSLTVFGFKFDIDAVDGTFFVHCACIFGAIRRQDETIDKTRQGEIAATSIENWHKRKCKIITESESAASSAYRERNRYFHCRSSSSSLPNWFCSQNENAGKMRLATCSEYHEPYDSSWCGACLWHRAKCRRGTVCIGTQNYCVGMRTLDVVMRTTSCSLCP